MREPPWKRLVEELKGIGYESVYLDRLRATLDTAEQHAILEKEIIQEMAYALGKSAAKVDHALLELELIERDLSSATDPPRRRELLEAFVAKRDQALRLRRDLLIHREAIGIRRNDILERTYPVPPPPIEPARAQCLVDSEQKKSPAVRERAAIGSGNRRPP